MWPRISFDPVKLFDLCVGDLLALDGYFVRACFVSGYPQLGNDLFIGLLDAPDVVDYLCDICPEWTDQLRAGVKRVGEQPPERIREAEAMLVRSSCPWNLGMAKSPAVWDALPWSYWDPSAIYDRVDVARKIVLDVGAGTGQVSLRCAPAAGFVWALEPVGRLRSYIEHKMAAAGFVNVRTLSGLAESIPLEDASVDVVILSNGSFGWNPEQELREFERVVRPGGSVLMLGPCNYGNDAILSAIRQVGGYDQFDFEVPCDGHKPGFVKRVV